MAPAFLCLLALALALSGCGERSFDAEEFVDEANREGARLALGEPLASTEDGVDVFALGFEGAAATGEAEADHAGGSLVVTEDSDAAREEWERCRAATLTCYRAANIVLYFESAPTEPEVARVDAAVRALAND